MIRAIGAAIQARAQEFADTVTAEMARAGRRRPATRRGGRAPSLGYSM